MNARFLDVLHNCADHGRFAVGNAIDIDLDCVFEKTVHQHRTVRRDVNCTRHVAPKIFLIVDKLHGAPAEDKRGPHQNRITNFVCNLDGFIGRDRGAAGSLPQAKFVEHGRK